MCIIRRTTNFDILATHSWDDEWGIESERYPIQKSPTVKLRAYWLSTATCSSLRMWSVLHLLRRRRGKSPSIGKTLCPKVFAIGTLSESRSWR